MRLFIAEPVCFGLGKWGKYKAITLGEQQRKKGAS